MAIHIQTSGAKCPGVRRIFSFEEALSATALPSGTLTCALWGRLFAGRLTNDSFVALRKGIESRFEAVEVASVAGRRPSFSRWKAGRPFQGRFVPLPEAEPNTGDALDQIERDRDRVRILLERYGVLFRELLARDLPALGWSRVFRALRLMELGGEVVSGCFFDGVPGPQFAAPEAFRLLGRPLPDDAVFWTSALDPASACGTALPGLSHLPHRAAGTFVVFHGPRVALVLRARRLEIRLPPDHAVLERCFGLFRWLMGRAFRPLSSVEIETANDQPVLESPYLPALLAFGFVREYRTIVLRRHWAN